MEFTYESDKYFDTILEMAYEKYCSEVRCHSFLVAKPKQTFGAFF